MYKFKYVIWLIGMGVLFSCNAKDLDDSYWRVDAKVNTVAGLFEVQFDDFNTYGSRLLLDGKVLKIYDSMSVSIEYEYPESSEDLKIIVLAIDSGGIACPVKFQLLDFSTIDIFISGEFGSCSDIPTILRKENELLFEFPGYKYGNMEKYSYRLGSSILVLK